MNSSKPNEEQDILTIFKKDLTEDLQFITLETLKVMNLISKICDESSFDKQVYWINLIENCNK